MARQRRGGFRPPELRGTLGTLLRSTLQQAGDVLERGARAAGAAASEARSRLEDVRASRSRHDALAELGEVVLDLIRRGEIDVAELPEAEELVRHLDELDAEGDGGSRGRDRDRAGDRDRAAIAHAPSRRRFDDRRPGRDADIEDEASAPDAAPDAADGTVSSARWRPPRPTKPTSVWRPPGVTARPARPPEPTPPGDDADPDAPTSRSSSRLSLPPDPHRKGGISFEDDDDLADYMHPDDVPPKSGPGGDP